jgi:hypothetical protein
MSDTGTCKFCHHGIETDAKSCPRCGSFSMSNMPFKAIAVLVLLAGYAALIGEYMYQPENIFHEWGIVAFLFLSLHVIVLAVIFCLPSRQWHPSQLVGMSR